MATATKSKKSATKKTAAPVKPLLDMGKTLKVGMIGAGAIAGSHCGPVQNYVGAEVVAIADTSRQRCEDVAKQFEIPRIYTDAKDLLADKDIDAVMIALPNFLHAPMSLAAINAGKHVLLDKPFALNMAEARAVAKAAKAKKKVFMLGMNQRYTPQSQAVHAMVQRGDLGDIYHAKAFWLRRSGCPRFGTWFGQKKLAGGGCTLDIGVHMLDLALYLMDNWKPVSVSGQIYTKFGNRGLGEGGWGKSDVGKHIFDVDDNATALIKFKNGATLGLDASWARHQETGNRDDVELYGTEGGATARGGKLFRFGKKGGEYEVLEVQGLKIRHPRLNRHVHWLDVILGKDKNDCTVEQSLAVQAILDAVYASSASGKEQKVKL